MSKQMLFEHHDSSDKFLLNNSYYIDDSNSKIGKLINDTLQFNDGTSFKLTKLSKIPDNCYTGDPRL
jgi:hypothetical protein